MAEGSLFLNIETLQTALGGINDLLGSSPEDGGPGSGLAGAAHLAADSPVQQVAGFKAVFSGEVSGVLDFDLGPALDDLTGLFESLRTAVQASPTAALDDFAGRLQAVDSGLNADFISTLQQTLTTIRSISDGVPENRTGVVAALLDQILSVLGSLDGPEAQTIRSWIESLAAMQETLLPIIEAAQSAPDPAALAVEVVQQTLTNTLDRLGFAGAARLITFLDDFPGNALSAGLVAELTGALDGALNAYGEVIVQVDADWPAFRDAGVAVVDFMQDLKEKLRAVLAVIERIVSAKIFQPNALSAYLQSLFDEALATPVAEAQQIDGPYNALLDRIDSAIEGIDLDLIRTDILGFFEQTRATLEQANLSSVGDFLQTQLATVTAAVDRLQQGVTDLLTQIQAFFGGLLDQMRGLAAKVGEFQGDGSFQFNFEQDLRALFNRARLAIGGDPANPDAPSLAGTLDDFQGTLDQFLQQINGLLVPVQNTVASVRTQAVDGINQFVTFLQSLDVADLVEQLRQQVQGILDQLGPIDFGVVVDPVLQVIEENTAKIREIDPSSLNDILRAALATALDVIVSIDFSVEISAPLKEQFDGVKALPAAALQALQQRYEQAIGILDALNPAQLLDALLAAFDVIEQAVSSLDVASLLQPLDQLHTQFLQDPLAQLRPSLLLQPVADLFQTFMLVFEELDPAALLAPLTAQLDALKGRVLAIDITSWVDDLLAAIAKVQDDLAAIRPSTLLAPLIEDFGRIESELDRFKPSIVFAPIADLVTPLLSLLEGIQQQAIDALFALFQAPLAILDRLRPAELTKFIQAQIDKVLGVLRAANFAARFAQIKAKHFDLTAAVQAGGVEAKIELAAFLDPDELLDDLGRGFNAIIVALEGLKTNVDLGDDLADLYARLRERMLAMLPPFARELMDPEKFKRVMRLADPTRFLADLDARFEAIKAKLLPIRPEEIAGELDATYESVLAIVAGLDLSDSLNQLKAAMTQAQAIVNSLRIDFLAADLNRALDDVQALAAALDPRRVFAELDAVHQEVADVVAATQPSVLLAGLGTTLAAVQALVSSLSLRATLADPLDQAWVAVQGILDGIDFTVILSPLIDKLDELEAEFFASLGEVENAFDQMLTAGQQVLSGSASVSAGISL